MEATTKAAENAVGLSQLHRLHAIESVGRGLEMEDAAVEADMMGVKPGTDQPASEDQMKITAVGSPVTVYAKPDPPVVTPPTNPPANPLTRAVLAAALVGIGGAGVVLGYVAADLMTKPEPPAVPHAIPVDNNDTRGIEFI